MPFSAALLLLVLGCGEAGSDQECQDGEARCQSVTEIQYCLGGDWMAAETCPPEQGDGFTITTICDSGVCRP